MKNSKNWNCPSGFPRELPLTSELSDALNTTSHSTLRKSSSSIGALMLTLLGWLRSSRRSALTSLNSASLTPTRLFSSFQESSLILARSRTLTINQYPKTCWFSGETSLLVKYRTNSVATITSSRETPYSMRLVLWSASFLALNTSWTPICESLWKCQSKIG